jgi:hypothetical protein
MTSSANDEWNHYELTMAIHLMEKEILRLRREKSNAAALDAKSLEHAIDFIKYNMEQSEITGGNGDL